MSLTCFGQPSIAGLTREYFITRISLPIWKIVFDELTDWMHRRISGTISECMNLIEIEQAYGDRILLDGALGTQTTMPFGTPEEVQQTVKGHIETLSADGAYIVSATHILDREVPIENLHAFVKTSRTAA